MSGPNKAIQIDNRLLGKFFFLDSLNGGYLTNDESSKLAYFYWKSIPFNNSKINYYHRVLKNTSYFFRNLSSMPYGNM